MQGIVGRGYSITVTVPEPLGVTEAVTVPLAGP